MSRTPRLLKGLRVLYRIRRELQQRFRPPKTLYVWNRVPYYRQLWEEACAAFGLDLVELTEDTWEVQQEGAVVTRINNCYLELDNPVTLTAAGNKRVTYELLQRDGLPVAAYQAFTLRDLAPMHRFMREHPGPFVVKPSYGTGSGLGVTTHLVEPRECARAAVFASLYCEEVLIEQHIPGEVYRLLYLGDRVIAASRRRGFWVTGDGASTIRQLYLDRRPASVGEEEWLGDPDYTHSLALQGLAPDDVPGSGERRLLKSVATPTTSTLEVRTVYDEDALESLAPEIVTSAERAARALRSEFCGVDIITPDPGSPLEKSGGVIGEINTTPGLHHHYRIAGSEGAEHIGVTVLRYIMGRNGSGQAGTATEAGAPTGRGQ